jgi:hypothetical protein
MLRTVMVPLQAQLLTRLDEEELILVSEKPAAAHVRESQRVGKLDLRCQTAK